jgi:hypothetical protein
MTIFFSSKLLVHFALTQDRAQLETMVLAQLVKKYHVSHINPISITIFTEASQWTLLF